MHPKSVRRVHSAEFKALVLAQCAEPGASVSAVALAHGLNANLVQKWLAGRGIKRAGLSASVARAPKVAKPLHFVAMKLPAPSEAGPVPQGIRIELQRGELSLCVTWPAECADACSAWLREVCAGLGT